MCFLCAGQYGHGDNYTVSLVEVGGTMSSQEVADQCGRYILPAIDLFGPEYIDLAVQLDVPPAMAACRADSGLDCTGVIDVNNSKLIQTGAKSFTVRFVLRSNLGFVCNGNGGFSETA